MCLLFEIVSTKFRFWIFLCGEICILCAKGKIENPAQNITIYNSFYGNSLYLRIFGKQSKSYIYLEYVWKIRLVFPSLQLFLVISKKYGFQRKTKIFVFHKFFISPFFSEKWAMKNEKSIFFIFCQIFVIFDDFSKL